MQGVMLFGHESKGESYVVTLADRKEVWLCVAVVCTKNLALVLTMAWVSDLC